MSLANSLALSLGWPNWALWCSCVVQCDSFLVLAFPRVQGAGVCTGEEIPQLVEGRPWLGRVSQPLLGHADAALVQRGLWRGMKTLWNCFSSYSLVERNVFEIRSLCRTCFASSLTIWSDEFVDFWSARANKLCWFCSGSFREAGRFLAADSSVLILLVSSSFVSWLSLSDFSASLLYHLFFLFEQVVCIGSVEELAQLSGVRVKDLHRERCVFVVLLINQSTCLNACLSVNASI